MEDLRCNMEDGMPETVFQCVIRYIDDSHDRDAVSLVCRRWCQIDAETRKHITIALCYTTTPQQLLQRFMFLESLKLKGQPRAAMFNLIREDWGGHATPWVNELATSFSCLTAVHFRRMIVTDANLERLGVSRGNVLLSLKLDRCSGFSTDGLLHIARNCKKLLTLYLEGSKIVEWNGEWLHEIALNNTVLQTLNIYRTGFSKVKYEDLVLIAKNCVLTSVKLCKYDSDNIYDLLDNMRKLKKFYASSFKTKVGKYPDARLFENLTSLGAGYFSLFQREWVCLFASGLKKVDLRYTYMTRMDYSGLINNCPNLEVLKARTEIGDYGLEYLSRLCKKLRKIRIEPIDMEPFVGEEGYISHQGLIALVKGCPDMEYVAVYVSSMTNACLELMGTQWKNLQNFRLVLLKSKIVKSDLPLDNGVRALLQGCDKLRGFALYLRRGALSDTGLRYVGMFATNVTWMLLSKVGTSDFGLLQFSEGCPKLKKLEMRGCHFSEKALARAVVSLKSLKYFWIEGYGGHKDGRDLAIMARPFWNIELIGGKPQLHVLGYYSIAGQRSDFPKYVKPFKLPCTLG